jgi:predicted unusual protein kinase regulating ubiquinone biosynthesis (AarF/ABC1/UbiB family)
MPKKPDRSSRVPTGRLERLARIGWMTGEFALGGAAEGLRRALGSTEGDASAFLNPANAERLAHHLSRMRGAAMKIGQMLSLADDQMIPPEFADALAILRQSADSMPEAQVRKTLAREYGKDWERHFREFDFAPIAAASIGQVHEAIGADGRELALKIQYPGVSESIDSDVDNLAIALSAARILPGELDLDPMLQEAKKQLRQEADYLAEAAFLRRYRDLIAPDPRFRVPDVDDALTTPHILVMERMLGLPLEDLTGTEHSQERRNEMGARLVELSFRELFEFRLMQTDPNFANYLLLPDGETIGLLDFGSTSDVGAEISRKFADLFRGLRSGSRHELVCACVQLGYLREDDSEILTDRFLELVQLMWEPLTMHGPYDFGSADVMKRGQELGMELVFKHGYWRTPAAETIFLQRKLDGTRMLCARIRARIDVGALLDPFLAG